MVASYDPTLPEVRDQIRFWVGDTDLENPLKQDEEYDAIIALNPNPKLAGAVMASALANEWAQRPDSFSDDGTSISWRERIKTWLATAASLRAQAGAEEAAASRVVDTDRFQRTDGDLGRAEYKFDPLWGSRR